MKTYHTFLFLIASCVGQKNDHSNTSIGTSNVPGKDINIDIPKESDALTNIIGTLTKSLAVSIKPNDSELNDTYNYEYDGDEYKYEFDEGNPDINAIIERPCEVYDTFCIRRFFAQHSKCEITGGTVPDPLFRAQGTINYPRVNIAATPTNVEYRGLSNARVEEFYINKATDNLIITLEFDAVSTFSNNTYLQFYIRGKEPIVTRDFAGLVYEKLSITVIIPQLNDLRLDKAEIFTYANVPVYPYVTGPQLAETTDPEALANFAAFLADIQVDQQEALLTEGTFYAATYIQYNICDFGLKVL